MIDHSANEELSRISTDDESTTKTNKESGIS